MIDLNADVAALFDDSALATAWTVTPKAGGAAYTLQGLLDVDDGPMLSGYALSANPVLHYATAAAPQLAVGDAIVQTGGVHWIVREAPRRSGDGLTSSAALGVAP